VTGPKKLRAAIAALIGFNLLDWAFTWFWISEEVTTEVNPVMDSIMGSGPWGFLAVKMALILLGSLMLWRYRHVEFAVKAGATLSLIYALLVGLHVGAAYWFVLQASFSAKADLFMGVVTPLMADGHQQVELVGYFAHQGYGQVDGRVMLGKSRVLAVRKIEIPPASSFTLDEGLYETDEQKK
jgi:hypothetical protein